MLHAAEETLPFFYYIPWFAWIAIIGAIVWGIVAIIGALGGRNKGVEEALKQNTAINEKLIERLDGIDGRLGAVEKTLNDIP
ncbi:hypothetical protein FB562_0716 [Homoserinimonas aerilata]|uniref:Uncharacterized protein n=1 Tax=Homoserinimonas aerilata TaxID=1162970 RepID=A0A542YHS3_9MICO|nr:hypothetical protein [Homoserinimonas aerilata]TQL47650.1 hypothetical protein FB562_0716 [Homoserinimonas aerilata]